MKQVATKRIDTTRVPTKSTFSRPRLVWKAFPESPAPKAPPRLVSDC